MSDAPAAKSNNLARIRDNQRRSRARRKEYLQELETKLRFCEQTGVEASAEIQNAARRVLEENKRLRALLRERGVSESELTTVMGNDFRTPQYGSAAPVLDSMLGQKRPCNGRTSCGVVPAPQPASTRPLPPTLSLSHQRSMRMEPRNRSASPHSVGSSSVDTPTSMSNPSFSHLPVALSQPEIPNPTFQHVTYPYEAPINLQWTYQHEPNYQPEQPLYNNNTSSCVYAANIIRSMRSGVGTELEADLGCHEPGTDCVVNNSIVFNAIEKYGDHNHGM